MHPALSVILFTTASGAGYGMLLWIAAYAAAGWIPADRWIGVCGFGWALLLVTGGLVSSTMHLGHPERAWRAMSQWRSSWLSREGVAAVATYVPVGVFAIGWVFLERHDGLWMLAGLVGAVMALVTVWCTGKIYSSLKTIRQWDHVLTAPVYIALAVMTGALWVAALAGTWGQWHDEMGWVALATIVFSALLKTRYWAAIDGGTSRTTPETATGLGAIGKVRLLEAPTTSESYVMREMGFKVARKHAEKLRRIALLAGFALPAVLTLLAVVTADATLSAVAMVLAALAGSAGVLVERWLFFAEARHIVTLYFGAEAA